jgi:hypothetical protein
MYCKVAKGITAVVFDWHNHSVLWQMTVKYQGKQLNIYTYFTSFPKVSRHGHFQLHEDFASLFLHPVWQPIAPSFHANVRDTYLYDDLEQREYVPLIHETINYTPIIFTNVSYCPVINKLLLHSWRVLGSDVFWLKCFLVFLSPLEQMLYSTGFSLHIFSHFIIRLPSIIRRYIVDIVN